MGCTISTPYDGFVKGNEGRIEEWAQFIKTLEGIERKEYKDIMMRSKQDLPEARACFPVFSGTVACKTVWDRVYKDSALYVAFMKNPHLKKAIDVCWETPGFTQTGGQPFEALYSPLANACALLAVARYLVKKSEQVAPA